MLIPHLSYCCLSALIAFAPLSIDMYLPGLPTIAANSAPRPPLRNSLYLVFSSVWRWAKRSMEKLRPTATVTNRRSMRD